MLCAIGLYMYCMRRTRNDCFTITITINIIGFCFPNSFLQVNTMKFLVGLNQAVILISNSSVLNLASTATRVTQNVTANSMLTFC